MTARDSQEFDEADARSLLHAPLATDDKYSRGVVELVTGSVEYPGAAVLGVSGAYRIGVGMVRYVGPDTVGQLVLCARPETVLGAGRAQAVVIGSGMSASTQSDDTLLQLRATLTSGIPAVVDAGALDLVTELDFRARASTSHVVITPHATELSRMMSDLTNRPMDFSPDAIASDPATAAARAADELGVVVCLKGYVTHVAAPVANSKARDTRVAFSITAPTTWLATAGTGDVLAGMMGAVLATTQPQSHANLARCVATAVYLHGRAAALASAGGPIVALDVAEALPAVMCEVLGA